MKHFHLTHRNFIDYNLIVRFNFSRVYNMTFIWKQGRIHLLFTNKFYSIRIKRIWTLIIPKFKVNYDIFISTKRKHNFYKRKSVYFQKFNNLIELIKPKIHIYIYIYTKGDYIILPKFKQIKTLARATDKHECCQPRLMYCTNLA